MTFQAYKAYFERIISTDPAVQQPPYDNPDYMDYTKLNWSRMNRWFKTGKISEELRATLQRIDKPQEWVVITEPWCGDAAHNIPFIEMMASLNPLISIRYELRDTEPFMINQYLTHGTKSIPKLVIRDAEGKDLAIWGPRPSGCQAIYADLTREKADFETVKVAIQNWYNADKGVEMQREIHELLNEAAG